MRYPVALALTFLEQRSKRLDRKVLGGDVVLHMSEYR